jgi:HEAT repeat protein/cyclophilin family peptidyl-prolyl cis-trans isomerase
VLRAEDSRTPAAPALREALRDSSESLRARAALACGRLQDSTLVPALLPLLEDRSSSVRQEAAFALGQIGNRSARPALEKALASGDSEVVELAIEALGKLGDKSSTAKVAEFLDDDSPRLRGTAAVALWRLADSTAIDALIERHDDPDPEVRWRVLYALEKIVNPDRIVLVAALHLGDPEWTVRAYAARTLGRQKSLRGTAYLIDRLLDSEPGVVVNALRALQLIADSTCGACTPRYAAALGHADPYVRVTAATLLAERFSLHAASVNQRSVAFDSLARHLRDPDAATRGACARALLAQRGGAALDVVKPLLTDSSVFARVPVIQAIGRLDSMVALPLLLERLGPGFPLLERMTAAEALGGLGARSAAAPLRLGLADSSVLMAASCAGALGDLGDRASIPDLAAAFDARGKDAEPDAREAIRDALRNLAGAAYTDSLERLHPAKAIARPVSDEQLLHPALARGAILHTERGDIEWAFYRDEAPQTVENFVRLARTGYFDGRVVHRVVPNFVIQDGDPTGTGSGGPGYTIRCEYNRLRYDPYQVGMALSGKDTGGSQWFITQSPQPHLNGRYTIFAHVTRGMDVVWRIVQGDRVLKVELLD